MVCAAIPVGGTLSAVVGSAYQISEIANVSALVALAGTVITACVYFGKKFIDRMMVINPLAAKAQSDLQELFSGATLVRELSLLNTFTSQTKQPTSFLTVLNQDSGSITMKQMGSPLHADLDPVADEDLSLETLEVLKNRKAIRLNNIEQTDDAIQPDVGPNSGGKSFRRKAQFLNVILHQTGAKCFCAEGACAPFSKIFFAVPKLSESGSSEGSLGAELEPIGKFLHGTKVDKRTLVFCDELGRGTSESAIAPRAKDILLTLQTAGARTSVASHNEPLITSLQDDTLRLVPHHPEMACLNGELYMTLRVLPGFPPKSSQPVVYADAVASKYRLGPKALAELREAILLERRVANS